ncbi:MAG: hypothetical protein KKA81_17360, partial [Bacteroidetes bacterium]|nr:hypothetical protein [Bacteroidota bacterium]
AHALTQGATTFTVSLRRRTIVGVDPNRNLTAEYSGTMSNQTCDNFVVASSAPVKLQILVPGVTAVDGDVSNNGRTGNPSDRTAGISFITTLNLCDPYWNQITNLGSNTTVQITASAPYYNQPANNYLENGTRLFTLAVLSSGSWTATSTDVDGVAPLYTADTSASIPVISSGAVKLQVLLPGETALPGSSTGKYQVYGTSQTAGQQFTVTVNAVDPNFNRYTGSDQMVDLKVTDPYVADGDIPYAQLINGYVSFNLTIKQAALTHKVTAFIYSGAPALNEDYSAFYEVKPNTACALQVILPGEVEKGGSSSGKDSAGIQTQTAGYPFKVTVNSVDKHWNKTTVYPAGGATIKLTPNDDYVSPITQPLDLSLGTTHFWFTLKTAKTDAKFVADDTDGTPLAASTSTIYTVVTSSATKLLLLVPNETPLPGSSTGKTGTVITQTAGNTFRITVNSCDNQYNKVLSGGGSAATIRVITPDDDYDATYSDKPLISGTTWFDLTIVTSKDNHRIIADGSGPLLQSATQYSMNVVPNTPTKLQLVCPGETVSPGSSPSGNGKTGSPQERTAGILYLVTVRGCDNWWNLVTSTEPTVEVLSETDDYEVVQSSHALTNGSTTFTVIMKTGEGTSHTLTTQYKGTMLSQTTGFVVISSAAVKLQILVPDELALKGSDTG